MSYHVNEIEFVPRHWNQNCNCFIPESYQARLEDERGRSLLICGDTREEVAAELVKMER